MPTPTPTPAPSPTPVSTPTPTAAPAEEANVFRLTPSKDSTLYQDSQGSVSNGSGQHTFAGRTNQGLLRRAVIAFDIVGAIPAGSQVTSVQLVLNMSRTSAPSLSVDLHKVLADWGEGASDAPANEGSGTNAAQGDATWVHRFFDDQTWQSQGGDFAQSPSASTPVGGLGKYTWTSPQMAADVQGWLDSPSTNFGWILLAEVGQGNTAKRFDSRENPTADNRPVLIVEIGQ